MVIVVDVVTIIVAIGFRLHMYFIKRVLRIIKLGMCYKMIKRGGVCALGIVLSINR